MEQPTQRQEGPPKCEFIHPRKQRRCGFVCRAGERYCGNHRQQMCQQGQGVEGEEQREPCPANPAQ